jgi:hypothetical protein
VGAGIAVFGSGASGQGPGPVTFSKQTFTLQEKDGNDFGFVDAPPKTKFGKEGPRRLSPGDQFTFHNRIVEGSKTVGGLYARCAVTTGGNFDKASAECTGAFKLATGSLFVAVGGPKVFNSTITGAVTGGTGAYAGATGEFTSPNKDNTTDTFTIYVPAGG